MVINSRADFINSAASGRKIPCPYCETLNNPDEKYCCRCGKQLINPSSALADSGRNAFNTAGSENTNQVSAFNRVTSANIDEEEEISAFALGLPKWDILPPQVVVRRKRK